MLSPASSQMSTRKAKCVLVFMGKSGWTGPRPGLFIRRLFIRQGHHAYTPPTGSRRKPSPEAERRCALELFADNRDGVTEALMIVHGFWKRIWRKMNATPVIKSIEEFIAAVRKDSSAWDDPNEPKWFRGEPRRLTPLLPTLYREGLGTFENPLLQMFRSRVSGYH